MAEVYLYLPKDLATAVWAHMLEDESEAEVGRVPILQAST